MELDMDESLMTQSKDQTEVVYFKEAAIKKLIGRETKQTPISLSKSMVYVTNKRLILLKLFEVSATEVAEGANQLATSSGTFYEVPLSAVAGVQTMTLQFNKKDVARFLDFYGGDESVLGRPGLEISYDGAAATGGAKLAMDDVLRRSAISKIMGKVESVSDKMLILGDEGLALGPRLSQTARGTGKTTGEQRVCATCGNLLTPEEKFCGKCGTKVG